MYRGVPAFGDPALGQLPGRFDVARGVDDGVVEGNILELDEELLPFGGQKGEIAADGVEFVGALFRLQFAPGIFQLSAFEGGQGRVGDALPVAVEEDVMVLGARGVTDKEEKQTAKRQLRTSEFTA